MATENELELLLKAAHEAKENSYSPYSKVKVGAAVLTQCGKILSGANVECASYGLGVCAERGLLTHAASRGFRSFKTIVVVSNLPEITPCGACRQFIVEFGTDIEVYTDCPVDGRGKPRKFGILELLPGAFTPRSLGTSGS
ncbi:probable cytidine deaminase [Galendromus occidentalis]|uniref:Cytidine deaminase n=1 Tax=Galendromus occidentalis TaxID=34638 RepID=A0AAJ6QVC0_9ACAR|nr:probable cytidine deaminase [Galendromus occidentalis]